MSNYKTDYITVAASQTDTVCGSTNATKADILETVIIVPANTSPGAVSIKDGSGSAITIFTGGATSVADLKPYPIHIGARSSSGAWKITTGASVSVIAVGKFT